MNLAPPDVHEHLHRAYLHATIMNHRQVARGPISLPASDVATTL
jgi:hypothetical protein